MVGEKEPLQADAPAPMEPVSLAIPTKWMEAMVLVVPLMARTTGDRVPAMLREQDPTPLASTAAQSDGLPLVLNAVLGLTPVNSKSNNGWAANLKK